MEIHSSNFHSAALPASTTASRPGDESSAGQTNRHASADEQREIERLKARDREVRAHEAAHLAAAGGHATSGAKFEYERGPDGVNYAVGGEVSIDTSAVAGDPQATLQKAQQVQRAALAPADPSGQDRQVAAQAAAMAAQARAELASAGSDEANALKSRIQASGASTEQGNESALHLVA